MQLFPSSTSVRLALLCAGALGLMGCDGNPPDVRVRDLASVSIPGVEAFNFQDEATAPLTMSTIAIRDQIRSRDKSARVQAWKGVTDGATSIDAMASHLDQTLGPAWQRSGDFRSYRDVIKVLMWETKGKPKRYYGFSTYTALSDQLGRRYHPLIVTYSLVTPPSFP